MKQNTHLYFYVLYYIIMWLYFF